MDNLTSNPRYCLHLKDSSLWAIRFENAIPVFGAGPLKPADLATDIITLDLPLTGDRLPNVRLLVNLCDSGITRIIAGKPRKGTKQS